MDEETYDFELNIEDTDTSELISTIRQLTDVWVNKMAEPVRAKDCDLDSRIGWIHRTKEAIIVTKKSRSTIDYYGGFEYIKKDHVIETGDWVFYMLESPITGERCEIIARALGE